MANMVSNEKVFVEIEYKDDSSFSFDIVLHSEDSTDQLAQVMMITRGTLMASIGRKATAYNSEGFPIASYVK